jgi:nitrite reductase/ring-hydroxylating ferredoxin subunit
MSDHASAPKWREDFPFESADDDLITRRECTRFLVLVSGGLAAGTALVGVASRRAEHQVTARVDIAALDDLAPGSALPFAYPDEHTPALLVRRPDGELVAFERSCPHLSCPVTYEPGSEHLGCHCHHGRFELATGRGTAGPPRELRPLRRIALAVEDGRVFAVGFMARRGA